VERLLSTCGSRWVSSSGRPRSLVRGGEQLLERGLQSTSCLAIGDPVRPGLVPGSEPSAPPDLLPLNSAGRPADPPRNSGSCRCWSATVAPDGILHAGPSPSPGCAGRPGHHHIALGLTGFQPQQGCHGAAGRAGPPSRYNGNRATAGGFSPVVAERPGRRGRISSRRPRRDPHPCQQARPSLLAGLRGGAIPGLPEADRRRCRSTGHRDRRVVREGSAGALSLPGGRRFVRIGLGPNPD